MQARVRGVLPRCSRRWIKHGDRTGCIRRRQRRARAAMASPIRIAMAWRHPSIRPRAPRAAESDGHSDDIFNHQPLWPDTLWHQPCKTMSNADRGGANVGQRCEIGMRAGCKAADARWDFLEPNWSVGPVIGDDRPALDSNFTPAQLADHQAICLRLRTGLARGNEITLVLFSAKGQTDDPSDRKQPQYPGIVIDCRLWRRSLVDRHISGLNS